MQLNIEVEGLRELENQLLELEQSVGRRALKSSLTSAAGKVKSEAKKRAPGSLKSAIFSSSKVRGVTVSTEETAATHTIGVHSSGPKRAPHAHLIEYGTKQRETEKPKRSRFGRRRARKNNVISIGGDEFVTLGTKRGRVRGRFYMRKAWRLQGGKKYVLRFKKSLAKKIDRLTQ